MFEIWPLGLVGLLAGVLVSWVMIDNRVPDWMVLFNPLLALLLALFFCFFVRGESLYNSIFTQKFGYLFTLTAPVGALWHTMRKRRR